jgi:hypothetical protein
MGRCKSGIRVGAIFGAKDGVCEFFGYGEYLGEISILDKRYPAPKGMLKGIRERAEGYGDDFDLSNPLIKLDTGGYVWGCECWWGPADETKKKLDRMEEVTAVDIEKYRSEEE